MRRVEFIVEPSKEKKTGVFHGWGFAVVEDKQRGVLGQQSVGICEDQGGQVFQVHPANVKFRDPVIFSKFN